MMTLFTLLIYVLSNVTPLVSNHTINDTFNISASNRVSRLEWRHQAKNTSGHFQLERSTDNKNYATIALILDGFPTKNGEVIFKYNDNLSKLDGGSFYYRLKEIGGEGTVSSAKMILVN